MRSAIPRGFAPLPRPGPLNPVCSLSASLPCRHVLHASCPHGDAPEPDSEGAWVLQTRGSTRGLAVANGSRQAVWEFFGTELEIAWVVGTPWQRRGIAKEAAVALVAWLTARPVRSITAHIHPDHHASAAVARAAGLAPTPERQDGEVRWECAGHAGGSGGSGRENDTTTQVP
ncbi:GNAT family N-acetyltransferase [Streptomyces griseoluteus]